MLTKRLVAPFIREGQYIMAYMFKYNVVAHAQNEIEGALSKRLARQVCVAAQHFEARDIVLKLMVIQDQEQLKKADSAKGKDAVERLIEELCLDMYNNDWDTYMQYPENKLEIKTDYVFECKFSVLQTE